MNATEKRPLFLPVDAETAAALNRAAAELQTHGARDMMAGGRVSVDVIERGLVALSGAYHHLAELVEVARGDRRPIGPDSREYVFPVRRSSGEVMGGVSVRWFADDAEGAHLRAVRVFTDDARFDHATVSLDREPSGVHP
jgi:hypothetical protein